MTPSPPAVVVSSVSKRFRLYRERNQSLKAALLRGRRSTFEEFWALKDVSFEIPTGSTFGLCGVNGSGKSTLLKCMARILRPDAGRITATGSLTALLELGSGFHPELSGRENVYLNGSILGLSKSDIERKFDAIVDFAGVAAFIDQPVKNYSSGMYVRLGFSVAINVDPDILLVDEVLAVGDANFQDRCLEKFADFRRAGKTVVIVSHATGSLRSMCDEVAWLDRGQLQQSGAASEVVDTYIDTQHAERGVTESGATRWGSAEIQVSRIEVSGPNGAATTLHSGDATAVRLHYRSHIPVTDPVFVLGMENLAGVAVWEQQSRDGGVITGTLLGEGTVELRIPSLSLQPGTYFLHASIVDHTTTHTYDFVRRGLRFDVEHGALRESGGIVALGGRWGEVTPNVPVTDPVGTSG